MDEPESIPVWIKVTLIFLAAILLFLGTVAYLEVYGIPGSYTITPISQFTGAPDTSSSPLINLSSSSPIASEVTGMDSFSNKFAAAPVSWTDSGATFSLSGAALQGNTLTLTLAIHVGNNATCVPLNLRLVADESGNLQGPDTLGFAFPGSGNCNGTPNTDYQNQDVIFSVDSKNFPLLFTTNNSSSTFFEISTTTGNGLQIQLPGTAG